ncbi:MAG: CSLREA domain-containing protein, partial [Chloroflexi bacterium]|nr:CSLREA domain-containing protein [Chloroflexota bacterium]
LGGTLTGQIPAGQSSVIISGVTYSKLESGVRLAVARGASGDSVAPGDSAAFALQQQPARNFAVTKTADTNDGACDADCSLREAIVAANAISPAEGIIALPAGVYTLTRTGASEDAAATGDLDIIGKATINGAGAGTTIIQAGTSAVNGIDRVFHLLASGESRLTLDGVMVRFGMTAGNGGGILNDGGSVALRNSAVISSTAGGVGGGIAQTGGSLTIQNSALYYNTAQGASGGAISLGGGAATVQNSTLSSNTAIGPTGGAGLFIATGASATVVASTIADNQNANSNALGAGVRNDGTVTLRRSLAARNLRSTGATQNCAARIGDDSAADGGYNLSDDATCFVDNANHNRVVADVKLGSLADNGGPTATQAPLVGSPALEQIPANLCVDASGAALTADQRGRVRPAPAGGKCDVGALEAGPYLVVTQITPVSPFINTTFSVTVQAQSADGAALTVSAATGVRLTLQGATGTLTGTLTGVIPAGQNSVVIGNLSHNKIEPNLKFTVERTSGDPMFDSDSALFNVRPLPTGYFVNGASGADTNNCLSAAAACKTIGKALSLSLDLDNIQIAAGTYQERLAITTGITIRGAGAAVTIVDAQLGGSVAVISAGKTVSITGMTFTNGMVRGNPGLGGGIRNLGTLTLSDSVLTNNQARGDDGGTNDGKDGKGGGIYSAGPLTLLNSVITRNFAYGGEGGKSCSGNFPLIFCSLRTSGSGTGGGLYLTGGSVTVTGSTVSNNTAGGGAFSSNFSNNISTYGFVGSARAGGIYLGAGSLAVSRSTLSGNGGRHGQFFQ